MELKRYRKVNRIKQFNVHADKPEFRIYQSLLLQ